MEVNEFNEGEFYDDFYLPGDDPLEKTAVSGLFGRMEDRKVTMLPGFDMSKPLPQGKAVRGEYPWMLKNKDGVTKVVNNKEEHDAARKLGFMTSKELHELGQPNIIADKILELEDKLSELIAELKKLIGDKDYEEFLVKRQKEVSKEEE